MDAPPGHNAAHTPTPLAVVSPSPDAQPLSVKGAEQMAAHHRILALNKAWKKERARQLRDGGSNEDGDSSSDTDSDEPSDAELPSPAPAAMPQLRPGAKPQPAASPGQSSASPAEGPRLSDSSSAPALARPPARAPCLSLTPVPLPELPRLSAPARPQPVPSPVPAAKIAAASTAATSLSSSASSSPSSSSSSVLVVPTPQPSVAAHAANAQALDAAEEPVLQHPHQAQAETMKGKPADKSGRIFPTSGELLAKIRQSVTQPAGSALSPTPGYSAPRDASNSARSGPSSSDAGSREAAGDHLADGRVFDQALLHTADGRPYTMLRGGTDGPDESARGALFPTNYTLHPIAPRYICPVRDCRRLLRNVTGLVGHISAKHCGGKYNDNLDGTISFVGWYKSEKNSPAIIVSRNPLPPDAPPAAEPSLPIITSAQQKRRLEQSSPIPTATTKPTPVPAPLIASDIPAPVPALTPKDRLLSDVCRYLHGFLSRKQTTSTRDDVRYMMHLPQRRSLPQSWIERHRGERLSAPIYVATLAYLVGDEVTGAEVCSQRYLHGGRLSLPCIALPSSIPEEAKLVFSKVPTCVGCFYRSTMQRQKNVCAWSAEGEGEGEHEVAPEKPETGLGEAPLADVSKKEVKRGEEKPATDSSRAPSLAKTRELRPKRQASEPDASPAPKAIRLSVGSGERPEAMLEMESWEMAPGLLTEGTGTENIAFSGAYLTSAQPIPILPDIGIHVIVAKPGSSKRWGAETNKVRACTVAAGKVRVKMGETSFLVGLNGAFHIKPGQSCLVENRFYLDATIHCFSVDDYGLVSEEH